MARSEEGEWREGGTRRPPSPVIGDLSKDFQARRLRPLWVPQRRQNVGDPGLLAVSENQAHFLGQRSFALVVGPLFNKYDGAGTGGEGTWGEGGRGVGGGRGG